MAAALEGGADEYLTKPVDHGALVARVKSMLRIKELNDAVQAQSAKLSEWNATLEKRVSEQLSQLESSVSVAEIFFAAACRGYYLGRRQRSSRKPSA